jgi:hypothetical protein
VGTRLIEELPEDLVKPPRFKGLDDNGTFVYEVPVMLGHNPRRVRRTLATLMLAGDA